MLWVGWMIHDGDAGLTAGGASLDGHAHRDPACPFPLGLGSAQALARERGAAAFRPVGHAQEETTVAVLAKGDVGQAAQRPGHVKGECLSTVREPPLLRFGEERGAVRPAPFALDRPRGPTAVESW